jgi:hypothetical protein
LSDAYIVHPGRYVPRRASEISLPYLRGPVLEQANAPFHKACSQLKFGKELLWSLADILHHLGTPASPPAFSSLLWSAPCGALGRPLRSRARRRALMRACDETQLGCTLWGWSSPAFGVAARERWSERSSGVRHGSVRRQLRDYVVGRRENRFSGATSDAHSDGVCLWSR